MNAALLRLLLACLLTLAIPLQGFAALGSGHNAPCGMSAMEMSMGDMPAQSSMPDGANQGKLPGTCPHCASHCASMNLATLTSPPLMAIYQSAKRATFAPLIQPLPNAPVHLPERPPKA